MLKIFSDTRTVWVWLLGLWLVWPQGAWAQGIIPKCNPLPVGENFCGVKDLFGLIVNIYNLALGLAAIVLMIVIIVSGIRMFLHGISENPSGELQNAKYTLTRGITGFVIVIGAYVVVNTLLTLLGVLNRDSYFSGAGLFM